MRFFVACLLAALAGCSSTSASSSSDAGSTDASSDAAADDAGVDADSADAAPTCTGLTPPQSSPECQACQDAKCCITASAAAAKPGTWTKSAALVCRQDNCAAECGTPAPKCGNITPSPASCTAAMQAACCNELTACGGSDECLALIYLCIDGQNCDPSAPCFADCRAKYPNGAPLFDRLDACGSKVVCP